MTFHDRSWATSTVPRGGHARELYVIENIAKSCTWSVTSKKCRKM